MQMRCVCNAKYVGPKSRGRNVVRATRYVGRRREGNRWHTPRTWGDRSVLVEAALQREAEGRQVCFTSVVISPEMEGLSDRDFEELYRPWILGREGREFPHYVALHRDTNVPHLHVLTARHKYSSRELEELKQQTYQRLRERERFVQLRRVRNRPPEQTRKRGPMSRDREPEERERNLRR